MASSSRAGEPGITRKVVVLAVVVVAVALLYAGGWFYAAMRLHDRLSERMAASQTGQVTFACDALSVRGFPFRIGAFCDSASVDDHRTGIAASVGPVRSAAQVYRPGHAVVEVDGPAQLRMSPDLAFVADWSLLRASIVAWTDGLDRGSLAYDGLKGRLSVPSADLSLGIAVRHGEAHARRSGEALDVAGSFDGLALHPGGREIPPVDATLDVTIAGAAEWLSTAGPPVDALYGVQMELHGFSLDLGEDTGVRLSGPLSVDEGGYVSGSLDLAIDGIAAWRDRISVAFPESRKAVSNVAKALTVLSGGTDRAQVKVSVKDGTVYLGLFPVGVIPPL
ncbi:DUF2125 domain-containing protein [Shinella daejeonensis]|uniref:DUF2125 domain-containing protein n=1 Tax=Shinella daejeonensis TaxID=659017 RepID=UPI0020C76381|nr:DUF2125 domain-containing protein [Shinella daejeonensis]MCP8897350.1 DUF2125 domain-containing protein [Shinella daejeonensis]